MAKIRHCVSFELLREIYYALVYSYVRYGICIWGNANQTALDPLKVLNHRAARIMTFAPFGRIDMKPVLDYLEILDIEDIFLLETMKLMYKMKNGFIPITLGHYFELQNVNLSHQYNLRRRPNRVQSIKFRTKYGENLYSIEGRSYGMMFLIIFEIAEHLTCSKNDTKCIFYD